MGTAIDQETEFIRLEQKDMIRVGHDARDGASEKTAAEQLRILKIKLPLADEGVGIGENGLDQGVAGDLTAGKD